MARPKGSKDKKPRKPRGGTGPTQILPGSQLAAITDAQEAPFGYTTRGYPRACRASKTKAPKTEHGARSLQKHLTDRGLLPAPKVPIDKGGRPKVSLDPEEVKKLATIGGTYAEMAAYLKVSVSTLKKYSSVIDEGRELGKLSLRRKARMLALEGNVPMLLHLSKHVLGEKDAPAQTNIAVMGGQGATIHLSPETAATLTKRFQEVCPDPSRFLFQEAEFEEVHEDA